MPQNTSFQFLVVKLHGVPFKLKFSQFKTAKESVLRDTFANTYKTPETIIKSIGKFQLINSYNIPRLFRYFIGILEMENDIHSETLLK